MKQIVIMPGGFHPFHAGHYALYKSAVEAFPNADVYVAATNDQKARPFPFAIKEKLAKLAGVASGRFVQVKSPFKAEEITSQYNPNEDVLIFVRSEKDKTEQPQPGGTKKDGSPSYFQPWTGENLKPFSKHAYIAYLPTVEFGPGIRSATEIRNAWPNLNDRQKTAMVMSLYPATQKNRELASNVVQMLDIGMSGGEGVSEAFDSKLISERPDKELERLEAYEKFLQVATEKLSKVPDSHLLDLAKKLSKIEMSSGFADTMDVMRSATTRSDNHLTPTVSKIYADEMQKRGFNKPQRDTPTRVHAGSVSISGPEAYWYNEISKWGGSVGREIAIDLVDAGYVENLKEFLYMLALIKTNPELRDEMQDSGALVGSLDEYKFYAKRLKDEGLIGDQQYLNSRFNDEKLQAALDARYKMTESTDYLEEK